MPAKTDNRTVTKARTTRAEPRSVSEVVDWIRERIRRGTFVPGQRLVEADIMREQPTATRTRVREALQRLSSEGLVTIEEFRGASVKRFTHDDLRQMYRARMALEGMAAADFAAADRPELKRKLQKIQAELNEIEDTIDHERFARLNDEWHQLIIEGSGNQFIRMFLERLRIPIYRLLITTFYSARRIDNANAGHRKITEAIVNGRARDAERLMRDHIAEGLETLSAMDLDLK
nr:GntR family transcriptional regulator [uncultured Steroidobacter sp.]